VKALVTQRRPGIADRFNRRLVTAWREKRGVEIGYVGNALAVPFLAIGGIGASTTRQSQKAAQRILELRSLERHIGEMAEIKDLQVALRVPEVGQMSR
jgi:hypothetical protein